MTTWTPVAKPSQAWSAQDAPPVRVFSPLVFSLRPVFDTGTSQGLWSKKSKPVSAWAIEAAP